LETIVIRKALCKICGFSYKVEESELAPLFCPVCNNNPNNIKYSFYNTDNPNNDL